MLSAYVPRPNGLACTEREPGAPIPADAVWIDLREITPDEEQLVESTLDIDVPTREEMLEIEASNRFYEENGALYMTATLVTKLDTDQPERTQVTFILTGAKLVTNRYTDPLPFRRFIAYAARHPTVSNSGAAVLAGLLEAIVNRIADVLEKVGADVDAISSKIFFRSYSSSAPLDFRHVLERIGQSGDLVSKAIESLVSLTRLLGFVQQSGNTQVTQDAARARYRTLSRDVLAMTEHSNFLGNKVQFLLDATLGMVSIDQNNVVKIFSVVTVFMLPPSFIAGFFGMNFERLPWLHESWGVSAAVVLMVLSALAPYLYFKRRRWL